MEDQLNSKRAQFCICCNKIVPDKCECIWSAVRELQDKVKKLEDSQYGYIERIGHLGRALHCLSEENEKLRKMPYKCPICEGNGFNYHAMIHKVDCKTCEGKGIVWG
jgi:hypothetical protein